MIKVNSALQHENIINLLNNYHDEDGVKYTYSNKKGITLFFETNEEDLETAAKKAKTAIKNESWGSVLYFQSVPAE